MDETPPLPLPPELVPPELVTPESPVVPERPATPARRKAPAAAFAAIAVLAIGALAIVLSMALKDSGAKLQPGWRRVTTPEGFNVGLPSGWKSVSTTNADKAYEALKSANPQLASLVKDQLGGSLSSLIKLLAFDTKSPTLAQQFATNMNVVVAPAAGVGLDTFLEQNLVQLRKTPGLAGVESSKLELPSGSAGLVTSQLTVNAPRGAQQVAITQYLLVNGTNGYILSFSTLPSFAATYKDTFREIAETFRFE